VFGSLSELSGWKRCGGGGVEALERWLLRELQLRRRLFVGNGVGAVDLVGLLDA